MEKIWKDIPEHPGYEASNDGQIRNSVTDNILSPMVGSTGYLVVTLRDPESPGKQVKRKVHRLVALAFLGPPVGAKTYVDHIDSNRTNASVSNLEWVTPRENTRRAIKDGYLTFAKGGGFARSDEEDRGQEYVPKCDRPYELHEETSYMDLFRKKV